MPISWGKLPENELRKKYFADFEKTAAQIEAAYVLCQGILACAPICYMISRFSNSGAK